MTGVAILRIYRTGICKGRREKNTAAISAPWDFCHHTIHMQCSPGYYHIHRKRQSDPSLLDHRCMFPLFQLDNTPSVETIWTSWINYGHVKIVVEKKYYIENDKR
jgi:hypothetical protein